MYFIVSLLGLAFGRPDVAVHDDVVLPLPIRHPSEKKIWGPASPVRDAVR